MKDGVAFPVLNINWQFDCSDRIGITTVKQFEMASATGIRSSRSEFFVRSGPGKRKEGTRTRTRTRTSLGSRNTNDEESKRPCALNTELRICGLSKSSTYPSVRIRS